MTETDGGRRSLPLTDLSEDERMFRDQVRQFAEERVRPLVAKMDKEAEIPRSLIDACFELGIMGVEIPEQHGGAGATFFMSVLVVEELARVHASVAVLVDVQNTLVTTRCAGKRSLRRAISPGWRRWVGAYALSEAGSGSDAFALACRATDRGRPLEPPAASSGSRTPPRRAVHRDGDVDPARRDTKGSPRSGGRSSRAFTWGRRTSSASAPRHLRLILEAAASPRRTCSVRWARATRSRSRR
jgi:hypothetical protein